MSCVINPEDSQRAFNAIVNTKLKFTVLQLPLKPNTEFTEKYFNVINQQVSNRGEYILTQTNAPLNKKRVSDMIYNYKGKDDTKVKEQAYAINKAIGQYSKYYIDLYEGKASEKPTVSFNAKVSAKLDELAKNMVDIVIKQQNQIDSSKKALIRADQIVVDTLSDIAGTINLVAQYSDGTGAIFDYATYRPNTKNFKMSNGEVVPINQGLSDKRLIAAKLSIDSYAQILTNQTKIEHYRQARTLPIMLLGKEDITDIQTVFSVPKDFKENITFVYGHFEYSDSKERNEALAKKYELKKLRQAKLKNLKEGTLEYDRMKSLIAALDKSIVDTMRNKSLGNLVMAIRNSIGGLSDISSLSNEDIQNYYTELQAFKEILSNEKKHILDNTEDSEAKEQFKTDVAKLQADIEQYILALEEQFESIANSIMKDNYVTIPKTIGNVSYVDNLIVARQSNVPHIKALGSLINTQQQKAYHKEIAFNNQIIEIKNKIKNANLNPQSILDSNGNLIKRLDYKFFEDSKDATTSWLNEHWKLKPDAMEKYNLRAKNKKKALDLSYSALAEIEPNKAQELKDQEFEEWDKLYNPEYAIYNSNRRLYFEPSQKAYDEYTSKEYKQIQGTPLEELYSLVTKFTDYAEDTMGVYLGPTFYPWIRKNFKDRLVDNPTEAFKHAFLDVTAIRQGDTTFGDIDPITGDVRQQIPKFFTNPFRDAEGNIDYSDRSRDLIKDFMLFAGVVYNYEAMAEIEPDIAVLRTALSLSKNFQVTDAIGRVKKGSQGEPIISENNPSKKRAEDIMNTLINQSVYGISLDPEIAKQIGREGVKFINDLNAKNIKMKLAFNFIPAATSFLVGKMSSFNMAKKIQRIAGNKFDFLGAEKEFWSRKKEITDFLIEVNPYADDVNKLKAELQSKNMLNKVFNDHNFLIFFAQGEKALTSTNAIMLAKQYGYDENGKLRLLKNAQGSKSVYELITSGELKKDKDYYKKLNQFRDTVKEFNSKAYGTLSHDDLVAYKSNVFLKSLMAFKSWMPGILMERFGKARYNTSLDYMDIGTHRALLEEFHREQGLSLAEYITSSIVPKIGNLIGDLVTFGYWNKNRVNEQIARYKYEQWAANNPEQAQYTSFEDYMEIKRRQIGYALKEIRTMIAMVGLIMFLGSGDDDPYYKKNVALRNIYRILNKSLTEVGFVYTPSEFVKLLKNPLPLVSVLDQVSKTLANTADEIRDNLYKENSKRDKADEFYYTLQWIDGWSSIDQLLEITQQAKRKDF